MLNKIKQVGVKSHQNSSDKVTTSSSAQKKDSVSFIILMGLSLLLPIFFIPSPFGFLFSKTILLSLVVILLLIMWIVARLKDGLFPVTKDPLLIIAVAIPLVYLISSIFSEATSISLIGSGFEVGTFISILLLFLLMFLSSSILKNNKRVSYFYFMFLTSFFLVSIFQLLRLFMGPEFLSLGVFNNVTSNLIGKWNELAIFYGLTAVLSLSMVEFAKGGFMKVIGALVLLISLLFIALVNFPMVWWIVGIFAFVLVSFVVYSNRFSANSKNPKRKTFPTVSLIVIIVSLTFLFGGASIGNKLSSHFGITNTEVRPSLESTIDIAKNSLDSKTGIFGVGPNRFVNQWLKHKPVGVNKTVFWNIDFNTGVSFVLTSLVTVGVIGFLLWVAFLTMLFYLSVKSISIVSKDKVRGTLFSLTLLANAYMWLFMVVYIPTNVIVALTFMFTGVLLALLIQGGVIKIKYISSSKNQKIDFILVLGLIFLILISVIGGYIISQKFVADAYTKKSLIELNKENGDLNETEANIIKAINLSESDSYYRFLSEIKLIKLQGLLTDDSKSEEELKNQFQTILAETIQNSIKAVEIDDTNYQNWVSLGRVYETVILFGVPEAYDQAQNAYAKAIKLSPRSPILMFTLGVLEYNNKDYENAVTILENAVILKPNYSDAKYFLGLTYYNLGRNEDAILQFSDVASLNPDNQDVKTILDNMKKGRSTFGGLQGVSSYVEEAGSEDNSKDEE